MFETKGSEESIKKLPSEKKRANLESTCILALIPDPGCKYISESETEGGRGSGDVAFFDDSFADAGMG